MSDRKNGYLEDEIICTHLQSNNSLGTRDVAIAAGVAGTAGIAAPVAGTVILSGVGFTSSGIAAGSIAAGIQAGIGDVAAGSLFATAQSIGATGGFVLWGPFAIATATVAGLGYLGIRAFQNWWGQSTQNQEENTEYLIENNGNNTNNQEIAIILRPICLECQRKLTRRIKRNLLRYRF